MAICDLSTVATAAPASLPSPPARTAHWCALCFQLPLFRFTRATKISLPPADIRSGCASSGASFNHSDRDKCVVCQTYLSYFLREELLDELEMFPYLDKKR